jgi:hypothetical protein
MLSKDEIRERPPGPVWATQFFRAAMEERRITGMPLTLDYHELLFEQFAFHFVQDSGHRMVDSSAPTDPVTPYAVWQLCSNLKGILTRIAGSDTESVSNLSEADYTGLEEDTRSIVEPLVMSSGRALENLKRGKNKRRSLAEFIEVIDRGLSQNGLAGWIACRCAVSLLANSSPLYYTMSPSGHYVSAAESPLRRSEEWRKVKMQLPAFFGSAIPEETDAAGRSMAAKIINLGLYNACPSHVRVEGVLVSVPKMVVGLATGKKEAYFDWLSHVPIQRYWMPDLVNGDDLANILKLLSERPLGWGGPTENLGRSAIRKIAEGIRHSNDEALIAGALVALIGSRFWNVVGLGTLRKMIESDRQRSDVASALFSIRGRRLNEEGPSQRMVQLAELIVKGKIQASKSTTTAACKFLLENSPTKLPPLKSISAFPKKAQIAGEFISRD